MGAVKSKTWLPLAWVILSVWGASRLVFGGPTCSDILQARMTEIAGEYPARIALPFPDHRLPLQRHFYTNLQEETDYYIRAVQFKLRMARSQETAEDADSPSLWAQFGLDTYIERNIFSTLCPKTENRCLPSMFRLRFYPATQGVRVDVVPGSERNLLKYDFEAETHLPFTEADILQLNCVLRRELHREDTYLWNYAGMIKWGTVQNEGSHITEDLDGISGATRLVQKSFGCAIPEGGLWTTLTVFAHAYETLQLFKDLAANALLNRYSAEQCEVAFNQYLNKEK